MNKEIRLSDYKLIVFDIDGTIQNSNHFLSPFTKNVLLKLHNANIPFTLATGKNLPAVKSLAETLNVKLPLILSNGCMLQSVDGSVIEKNVLPVAITYQVIGICEVSGWDLAVYLDDGIYIKEMTHNLELLIEYGSPGLIEIRNWQNVADRLKDVHKCLVIERTNPTRIFELDAVFNCELGDKVGFCHTLPDMLEVMPKGVSKLSALLKLSGLLGISI